jgi:hypothetical protein
MKLKEILTFVALPAEANKTVRHAQVSASEEINKNSTS